VLSNRSIFPDLYKMEGERTGGIIGPYCKRDGSSVHLGQIGRLATSSLVIKRFSCSFLKDNTMKKRCVCCRKLTEKWQKVNGGSTHCFDGCYSTTGRDSRTIDGQPAWLLNEGKKAWAPERLWSTARS
jgi:hypothetical protein